MPLSQFHTLQVNITRLRALEVNTTNGWLHACTRGKYDYDWLLACTKCKYDYYWPVACTEVNTTTTGQLRAPKVSTSGIC